MTSVQTYDDLINRVGGGYTLMQPVWGQLATNAVLFPGNNLVFSRIGWTKALPNPLPTGVSAYIPTEFALGSSNGTGPYLFAKLINLGSLNLGTNTFTSGSSMPTQTVFNSSLNTYSPVMVEFTTAANATPGSFSITYTNQAGTSGIVLTSTALPASAPLGSGGWVKLNTTDAGVRSISAGSQSGGTTPSGVMKFWGVIPISLMETSQLATGSPAIDNFLTSAFNIVRLGAGDVMGVFSLGAVTARVVIGSVTLLGDS